MESGVRLRGILPQSRSVVFKLPLQSSHALMRVVVPRHIRRSFATAWKLHFRRKSPKTLIMASSQGRVIATEIASRTSSVGRYGFVAGADARMTRLCPIYPGHTGDCRSSMASPWSTHLLRGFSVTTLLPNASSWTRRQGPTKIRTASHRRRDTGTCQCGTTRDAACLCRTVSRGLLLERARSADL